eukprot:6460940-Amphidinium_carterae.3
MSNSHNPSLPAPQAVADGAARVPHGAPRVHITRQTSSASLRLRSPQEPYLRERHTTTCTSRTSSRRTHQAPIISLTLNLLLPLRAPQVPTSHPAQQYQHIIVREDAGLTTSTTSSSTRTLSTSRSQSNYFHNIEHTFHYAHHKYQGSLHAQQRQRQTHFHNITHLIHNIEYIFYHHHKH